MCNNSCKSYKQIAVGEMTTATIAGFGLDSLMFQTDVFLGMASTLGSTEQLDSYR